MEENAVSATHRFPYSLLFPHLGKSFCDLTSLFRILAFFAELIEFFHTLFPGWILFSSRHLKFSLESYAPSAKTDLILVAEPSLLLFKTCLSSSSITLPSCTLSSVNLQCKDFLGLMFTATSDLRWPFFLFCVSHLSGIHWHLFVTLIPVLSTAMMRLSSSNSLLLLPSMSRFFFVA